MNEKERGKEDREGRRKVYVSPYLEHAPAFAGDVIAQNATAVEPRHVRHGAHCGEGMRERRHVRHGAHCGEGMRERREVRRWCDLEHSIKRHSIYG